MNKDCKSALVLDHVVYDCIEFHRNGFQNDSDLNSNIQIKVSGDEDKKNYRVSLLLEGTKQNEYDMKIRVSGFFHLEMDNIDGKVSEDELIRNNAVAILMPYLRSEVSLLTSQPETDCVVMPVFNVNAMLSDEDR